MLSLNDVIRIIVTWVWGTDSVAQMVFHYLCTQTSSSTYSAWLDNINTNFALAWDNIEAYITNDLVGSTMEMLLWDFSNNRWDGVANKAVTNVDGAAITDYSSHGACGLVKILTDANRRQARKFIPGIVEGQITGGFIDATPLIAMVDFADDLDALLASGGGALEFCTFNTEPTSPVYETASTARGSVIAEATVAYQRRRKPGVGLT